MTRTPEPPPRFREALESIARARVQPEISLAEVPPPPRLAPYSVALTADVKSRRDEDQELASGRFVLMHDPDSQEVWQSDFRIVTMTRAHIEPDVAEDPCLPSVAWAWLTEALASNALSETALAGTVTRTMSQSYGDLADRGAENIVEIRASWSPSSPDIRPHLEAWCRLLLTAGGMQIVPEGVAQLVARAK